MAVTGKSFLIDTTVCIGCHSCQVACKQWHELPADEVDEGYANRGTFQLPGDTSHTCWVLVRFREGERPDGSLFWNFVRTSCRHCVDAPCKQAAEFPDSIVVDPETGAVLFQDGAARERFERIRDACPWKIPRQGPDGRLYKCVMCVDRVHNGLLPACVQACPAGGLHFGDRADMLALAEERLATLRGRFPDAAVLDAREVRLLILMGDRESRHELEPERAPAAAGGA